MNNYLKAILFLIIINASHLQAENHHVTKDSILIEKNYTAALRLYREGFYNQVLDSLKLAYETGIRTYGKNYPALRKINNALGITYRTIGQYSNAIDRFLFVEQSYLADSGNHENSIAKLYNNIGNVYYSRFNYGTALEYYQRAADIFSKQKNIDYEGIADIYYSIANIHYELRNNKNALDIINEYTRYAYPETKLLFLNLKSAVLQVLDDYEGAYLNYKNAINYAEELYSESELSVLFQYLNFAKFLITNNYFGEARKVLDKVQGILTGKNITDWLVLSLYHKTEGLYNESLNVETRDIDAFINQKAENLAQAVECYKKGLEAMSFDPGINPDKVLKTENCRSLTQTLDFLKLIADTYVSMADLYKENIQEEYATAIFSALDYYKLTSDLIQMARKEIYSDNNKMQISELEEATFNNITRTAYEAYEITGENEIIEFAFSNSERQKASSVFDRLTDQLAKENSLIPDSLTELEKSLNYSITSYNERLYDLKESGRSDPVLISQIDSVLFQLKKQREELNDFLERKYQEYYNLKYSNTAVTINDIKENLDNNEVLIEYVLNDNDTVPKLYSFFISKLDTKFKKHDIDPSFFDSLEETFRFLSDPEFMFTNNQESKEFCIAAGSLYNDLIGPFKNSIINKRLIIIPDGKLSYIPFDALLSETPDTTGLIQFQRLPYLIRKNTVSYAYSANLLINFSYAEKNSRNRLLAIAPEYKTDTVVFKDKKLILTPLPGTVREVDMISREIKTEMFTGDKATEKNFRQYCSDFDILHLAMHAFINDSLPAWSRFAFSQNAGKSRENDGWLNTADIYNLDLNSRLTVLSACNTGTGHLRKGEGVMSLARGFIYAGCPSIIMTLWEVEDNAGTSIMTSFYKNLRRGKPTDIALRLSKLEYLENANPRLAHPHYWLSYVNIGNTNPLFRSTDLYFFIIVIITMIGIITNQFTKFKKNKKSSRLL